MDNTFNLVREKLGSDVNCKTVFECIRTDDQLKLPVCAAIVEKEGDFSIFVFRLNRVPCTTVGDLNLEMVVPVDKNFRCQAAAPSPSKPNEQGEYHLTIRSPTKSVLLEMPRESKATDFLTEVVKLANTRLELNRSFSESEEQRWLDKYGGQPSTSMSTPKASRPVPAASYSTPRMPQFSPPLYQSTPVSTVPPTQFPPVQQLSESVLDLFDPLKQQAGTDVPTDLEDFEGPDSSTFNIKDELSESMEVAEKEIKIPDLHGKPKRLTHREKFVRQFLLERTDQFSYIQNFKVFCGSWNVNGQAPEESLNGWLLVDKEPPDIYSIGLQETDLSKDAFFFGESAKAVRWLHLIASCLNSRVPYQRVGSVRLVGITLFVFIQEKHIPHVSLVDTATVATGIMGIMGNKGGVSVRFTLHNTTFCFVNSHLAAHQEEYERRNADYKEIVTKTKLKPSDYSMGIVDHDVVFWVGDLNYRIDMNIDVVKGHIKRGNYMELIKNDQLYKLMKNNAEVFRTFKEGIPNFDPTFKYDIGTDTYDTSEKQRIPAYCDRILWRGSNIEQLRFSSHPYLRSSDHKPVSALFSVGVKVIDQSKFKRVYADILKDIDRMENEYLPQIKLDKTECVFFDVKFLDRQLQIVTITNVGQVPVEYEFINKGSDIGYSRPWLQVIPFKGIINAGDSFEIVLEVFVDKDIVSQLNTGQEKIDDVLVLHLTGGKDHFITVTGNYLMSSFGSSIEALIQLKGPIREVPVADLLNISQPGSLSRVDVAKEGTKLYMVPKEIWKQVEFLIKNGLATEELFQQPGRRSELQFIRDCLDTGKPGVIPDRVSVHSVAETLLLFLECLAEPVIPFHNYYQCLSGANNYMLCKQVLSKIPDCHRNTFMYICGFLKEVLRHSVINDTDPKLLATLFGEVMLRPPPSSGTSRKSKLFMPKDQKRMIRDQEIRRSAFMYYFITLDMD